MPTIDDVAREAGVSKTTVSRVLNGKAIGHMNPTTLIRVQEAIARLNYRPSSFAKGLKLKRSHTVGLVVPDISNPFYPALVKGLEETLWANGYAMLLCNTSNVLEREEAYYRMLDTRQVDGLILDCKRLPSPTYENLVNVPTVVLDAHPNLPVDSVTVDNRKGAYLATEHLIRCGHRRIGHIGGTKGGQVSGERLRGFRQAMHDAGLPIEPAYCVYSRYRMEDGYQIALRMLNLPEPPTALFVASDYMALGVLKAMQSRGIHVPNEMAVVGFDDTPVAAMVTPALTTVRQPVYELGATAARMVMERISGQVVGPKQAVILEPELIVRDSTRQARTLAD